MAMASKRSKRKGSSNNSKKSNKGNWNNGNANDTSQGGSRGSSRGRGSRSSRGRGSNIVDRRLPGKNSLISSCFLSKVFIFLRVAATAAEAAAATATYNSSSGSSKSKQRTKQHTESVAIFFRVASHPYQPSPLLPSLCFFAEANHNKKQEIFKHFSFSFA